MTIEENISAAFCEALDDLSDKHLEALRAAFESGPVSNPNKLLAWLHQDIIEQLRYRGY